MRLMRSLLLLSALAVLTAVLFPLVSEAVDKDKNDLPAPIGTRITDFTLTDATEGKPWAWADQTRDAKAVVVAAERVIKAVEKL